MIIEILTSTEDDLISGFEFYNRQLKRLGDYFLDSIFSDIESLYLQAGVHALHYGYYRLFSKRFPFAIYYRIQNNTIRIYAVLDCGRDPAWVREKLS